LVDGFWKVYLLFFDVVDALRAGRGTGSTNHLCFG
jgi:hypothetical protein